LVGQEKNSDAFSRVFAEYARQDLHVVTTHEIQFTRNELKENVSGTDYYVDLNFYAHEYDQSPNVFCQRKGYSLSVIRGHGPDDFWFPLGSSSSPGVYYDSHQKPVIKNAFTNLESFSALECVWYDIARKP